MRGRWKWLAIVPATLLVIALLLIVFADRLVDRDYLKQQLIQQAANAGYVLELNDLQWKLLPQLHLALTDLHAQAANDTTQVIRLEKMAAYVSVTALLQQKLQINELTVSGLNISNNGEPSLQLVQFSGSVDDLNTVGRPFTVSGKLNDSPWQADIRYDLNQATATEVAITIEQLNIDTLAPAPSKKAQTAKIAGKPKAGGAPATAAAKATEEPLGAALAAVLKYPGNYRLTIGQLRARGFDVSNLALSAAVAGDTIAIEQLDLNAYQGQAKHIGKFVVDAKQALQFELQAQYSGIQAGALAQAINPANPAASGGVLNGRADFNSRGRNSAQLTENLHGKLQLAIDNTQLNQFNLEQTICKAATDALKIAPIDAQWSAHSQLSALRFDGQVKQGVLHIQQLQGELDSARISGRGAVDLAKQFANLKIDAQLTQAYRQANTCPAINQTLRDITWPLACEGSYRERAFGETCGADKAKLQKIVADRLLKKVLGNEKSSVLDKLKGLFR